jgi:hypothetical protein
MLMPSNKNEPKKRREIRNYKEKNINILKIDPKLV